VSKAVTTSNRMDGFLSKCIASAFLMTEIVRRVSFLIDAKTEHGLSIDQSEAENPEEEVVGEGD